MIDSWTELNILMPTRIIKFGSAAYSNTEILIAGGIYGDTKNE